MAKPLSADRLVSALRAEGVKVTEYPGWRTHNRNHKGSWNDLNGIVIHHTAGRDSRSFCFTGNASLPGPLCHTHLAKNGTATMIGYGRANHAGTFAQNAYNAMLNESSTHPRPDSSEPVDANARTYGIEIENLGNGKDPYPAVQYEAAVRWATAICRAHGWSADSVIGHKEGTRRKIDPSFDMNTFRKDVAERLAHAADWDPNQEEEDPMAGMSKQDVHNAVWFIDDITAPTDAPDLDTNPNWQPQSYLRSTYSAARRIEGQLAAQNTAISELTKTVAALASNSEAIDADALVARIQGEIEKVVVRLDVS